MGNPLQKNNYQEDNVPALVGLAIVVILFITMIVSVAYINKENEREYTNQEIQYNTNIMNNCNNYGGVFKTIDGLNYCFFKDKKEYYGVSGYGTFFPPNFLDFDGYNRVLLEDSQGFIEYKNKIAKDNLKLIP